MKIKQEEKAFQPITITLETERESQLLAAALAKIDAGALEDDLIYKIYNACCDAQGIHWGRVFAVSGGDVKIKEV